MHEHELLAKLTYRLGDAAAYLHGLTGMAEDPGSGATANLSNPENDRQGSQ